MSVRRQLPSQRPDHDSGIGFHLPLSTRDRTGKSWRRSLPVAAIRRPRMSSHIRQGLTPERQSRVPCERFPWDAEEETPANSVWLPLRADAALALIATG